MVHAGLDTSQIKQKQTPALSIFFPQIKKKTTRTKKNKNKKWDVFNGLTLAN